MYAQEHLILHPSALKLLLLVSRKKVFKARIVLGDSFTASKKDQWQRDINRYYYACGCDTGMKAFILGFICFSFISISGFVMSLLSVRQSLILFVMGAVTFSFIGKLYGLIKARMRLKRTIIEIEASWKWKHNHLPTLT